MNLDESSRIRASFLLVDRKFVLYVELEDDTKKTSYEAIGASLFSSIRSTVISYVTIFEIMWRQQELYQQLSKFWYYRHETEEESSGCLRSFKIFPILNFLATAIAYIYFT